VHQESSALLLTSQRVIDKGAAVAQHAGYAAAVTVREQVLATALEAAYANGSFPTTLARELTGGGPTIVADLFLGQPAMECEGATGLLVLSLGAWGRLRVTEAGLTQDVEIIAQIELTTTPRFAPGSSVKLDPLREEIIVRSWQAQVTSPGTPPAIVAYLTGPAFRERVQTMLRDAVAFRVIKLPSIDVSFLGPLGRMATQIDGVVRNGTLLLGFTIDNDTQTIAGSPPALQDFAGSHDIAGVVNPDATLLFLDELNTRITEEVDDEGATLDRLDAHPEAGHFRVSGAVSKSSGTVNFSFHLVPRMFHTRPGASFPAHPKSRRVNPQTWAALEFRIEAVSTDVDRSWWVVVLEVFTGILTVGFAVMVIESFVSAAADSFSGKLHAARPGSASNRVRRTVPPLGGIGVRIGVDRFEISPDGVFVGISIAAKPSPDAVTGPVLLPSTYAGHRLRYHLRLPSGVFADDPALRVAWRVEDRTNAHTVVDSDDRAAHRLQVEFTPESSAGATDFTITARVYRQLGTQISEVSSRSINLHIRGPLPPQTYVRWRSQVKNPQIALGADGETWNYTGDAQVRRWSEWHRTDQPCLAVNAENRYRHDFETADALPFPMRLLESHRKGLCPYCFFGGPAGLHASL
jgi:hypothetical protein